MRTSRRVRSAMGLVALAGILAAGLSLSGCRKDDAVSANGETTKVRIGYIGLTCEAPLFTALEKGFFKEEGLDVEMVRCEWATYKDALALGRYDVTHHLVMYFLKPIEQGMDVKFTAGVHRGCLRVQAPKGGSIRTVKDLKGKIIGVPGMGTPPFMFASRVMGANGVDPSRDVRWRVYPAGELGLVMDRGLVDAVATSEPVGSLLLEGGKVQNVADQAKDLPYRDEYCCAVLVNGKFLAKNPKTSAAATRAILKAAKWVDANPRAAARLSVETGFIASTPELNAYAIANLSYVPSVIGAQNAVISAASELKKGGLLEDRTDVDALARKAFVQLDGVTDQWLETVVVNKEPDGQLLPNQDVARLSAVFRTSPVPGCCKGERR